MRGGQLLSASRVAMLIALATAGSACSAVPPPPSYEPYPITIAQPDGTPCAGFEVEKLVVGADSGDRGGLWGISATGDGVTRYDLLWPVGFTARKGPAGVEVLDRSGHVVVAEGGYVPRAQVCPTDQTHLRIDAFLGFNMPSAVP